jgi:hypothetical protein
LQKPARVVDFPPHDKDREGVARGLANAKLYLWTSRAGVAWGIIAAHRTALQEWTMERLVHRLWSRRDVVNDDQIACTVTPPGMRA